MELTLRQPRSFLAPPWLGTWAVIGLTILLTFLFVVRPAVLKVTTPLVDEAVRPPELQPVPEPEPEPEPEIERQVAPEVLDREQALSEWLQSLAAGDVYVSRSDVTRLVRTDMEQSVYTLRSWLRDE